MLLLEFLATFAWSCWESASPSSAISPHLYARQSLSGILCVLGMVMQQCCSYVLSRLVGHPFPPPQVWDALFSYSHTGLLGDAWLRGHCLLLGLKASSNRIRKEGKGPCPQRLIPLSWSDCEVRVLTAESFLPLQEMRMEAAELPWAGTKVDKKPM